MTRLDCCLRDWATRWRAFIAAPLACITAAVESPRSVACVYFRVGRSCKRLPLNALLAASSSVSVAFQPRD